MRPGRLRHSAKLQARSSGLDALGQRVVEWIDVLDFSCAVIPLAGRELIAGQQVAAETTHRIEMYFRPGISADLRVLFKGRIFEIHAALNLEERDQELHLFCSEGVTNG